MKHLNPLAKRHTVDVLHDQIRAILGTDNAFVHVDEVRTRQLRADAELSANPSKLVWRGQNPVIVTLDSNRLAGISEFLLLRWRGEKHIARATTPKFLDDSIISDLCAFVHVSTPAGSLTTDTTRGQ